VAGESPDCAGGPDRLVVAIVYNVRSDWDKFEPTCVADSVLASAINEFYAEVDEPVQFGGVLTSCGLCEHNNCKPSWPVLQRMRELSRDVVRERDVWPSIYAVWRAVEWKLKC
jgi:hypothetical protein